MTWWPVFASLLALALVLLLLWLERRFGACDYCRDVDLRGHACPVCAGKGKR